MKRRDSGLSLAMFLVVVAVVGVSGGRLQRFFRHHLHLVRRRGHDHPTGQGSTLTTVGSTASTGISTDTSVAAGNVTSGTTTPTVQADGLASPAQSVAEVLGPSVVNIKVTDTYSVSDSFGFGPAQSQPYAAEGSGVIYRSDGMIITNNHVVTNEYTGNPVATIKVTLATGEELDATLVGRDPLTDLAIIKVKTDKQLVAAQFVGVLPAGRGIRRGHR